jgi:large subunit ribosomal protein L21
MSMYAVVTSGGKQYRVEAGGELTVERLDADAGSTVTFDRVLLVGDGDTVSVGTPTVAGASVTGTVIGEALGPKLVVFKFKQKVKYRRTTGHRQHLTRVRIDEISAAGKTATAEKSPAKEAPEQVAEPVADKPKRSRARKPAASAADVTAGTAKRAAKADEDAAAEADKPKRTRTRKPKAEAPEPSGAAEPQE